VNVAAEGGLTVHSRLAGDEREGSERLLTLSSSVTGAEGGEMIEDGVNEFRRKFVEHRRGSSGSAGVKRGLWALWNCLDGRQETYRRKRGCCLMRRSREEGRSREAVDSVGGVSSLLFFVSRCSTSTSAAIWVKWENGEWKSSEIEGWFRCSHFDSLDWLKETH
jgi:hypothetical protein